MTDDIEYEDEFPTLADEPGVDDDVLVDGEPTEEPAASPKNDEVPPPDEE